MGTVITENPIYIKRFYGGHDRGVCYHVAIDRSYVELTENEIKIMIAKLQVSLLECPSVKDV